MRHMEGTREQDLLALRSRALDVRKVMDLAGKVRGGQILMVGSGK